jgi:hypothetical protein
MLNRELTAPGLIEVPPRLRFSQSFLISVRYKGSDSEYCGTAVFVLRVLDQS